MTFDEAQQKAAGLGIAYVEASAYSGENVEGIFEAISRLLIENSEKTRERSSLKLNSSAIQKFNSCCNSS